MLTGLFFGVILMQGNVSSAFCSFLNLFITKKKDGFRYNGAALNLNAFTRAHSVSDWKILFNILFCNTSYQFLPSPCIVPKHNTT